MARSVASYVACNVYVSAGRQAHAPILLDVLRKAQERCEFLRRQQPLPQSNGKIDQNDSSDSKPKLNQIAVVHAFADVSYDRSSLHLAGTAACVGDVASLIATSALTELTSTNENDRNGISSGKESRHPFVGMVDHVSVMSLDLFSDGDFDKPSERSVGLAQVDESTSFKAPDAQGQAAIQIGKAMSNVGAKVYYYGSADPDCTPLAQVRRERTEFFKSGGLEQCSTDYQDSASMGVATVGSPSTFVENFNIRLSASCTKEEARSLSKMVRERDGGIVGVEALTLPYSEGSYEVACNLLEPKRGSSDMIVKAAKEWANKHGGESCIEETYRVGTTAEQCLEVLSNIDLRHHDKTVYDRYAGYLSAS